MGSGDVEEASVLDGIAAKGNPDRQATARILGAAECLNLEQECERA
jgi:hypothetical protein